MQKVEYFLTGLEILTWCSKLRHKEKSLV